MGKIIFFILVFILIVITVFLLSVLARYLFLKALIIIAKIKCFFTSKDISNNKKVPLNIKKSKIIGFRFKSLLRNLIYKIKTLTFVKYYLHKPKATLLALFIIVSFLAFIIVYNKSWVPAAIFQISSIIFLASIIVFPICFIIKIMNGKSLYDKFSSSAVVYCFVLLVGILPIFLVFDIFSKSTKNNNLFYSILIICVFTYYLVFVSIAIFKGMHIFKKKFSKILFAFPLCIYVYFVGGLVFGVYTYIAFRENYAGVEYVEAIDKVLKSNTLTDENYWLTCWRWIKIGLEGFFSYPSNSLRCFMTVYQYFIGKYVELVLLGLIVSNFLQEEND